MVLNNKETINFKVDFIGIGDQRSASSWIFQCLKEHPDICVSKGKETRFFERDDLYKKGINFYKSFFNLCGKDKIKGEFSPSYMHSPKVSHRIKDYFPEVKLIVCLRNPIEKLYVGYWYDRIEGTGATIIYKDFEDAIERFPRYIERNFYYQKLKNYFNIFPRENILVLIYEDIQNDPVKFIHNIYHFLGVREDFVPLLVKNRINISGTKRLRFPILNWIAFKTYRFLEKYSFSKKLIRMVNREKIASILTQISSKKVGNKIERHPMNSKTRQYLQDIYREDIKNLEEIIKRDLSFWQ